MVVSLSAGLLALGAPRPNRLRNARERRRPCQRYRTSSLVSDYYGKRCIGLWNVTGDLENNIVEITERRTKVDTP